MRRRLLALALVAAPVLIVQTRAWAVFTDSSGASASFSTTSLALPTSPLASAGICVPAVGDHVVLVWTATGSLWADGYEIARSTVSGGPYSVVGTVVGQATTIYIDAPPAFSTTYYYVVRATKNSWRSADTAQVSRTTKSSLCL